MRLGNRAWLVLAALTVGVLALPGAEAKGPRTPPNILVIVIDTLRADALGTYGQVKPTSPHIDAFAKEAVVWERAWTQYTWTLPSFVTYMSSRFARTHGWTFKMGKLSTYGVLDNRAPMLAEVLHDAGYATSGHYANAHLRADLGMARGFDTWAKAADVGVARDGAAEISRWDSDEKPNFLYVHLMSCHEALQPSPEAQAAVGSTASYEKGVGIRFGRWTDAAEADRPRVAEELRLAYLASVRDADTHVGTILDALDKSGHADDTVVALFADHGELLGDHGMWGHPALVWEELTHVPLIIRAPGQAPRRITDRVGRLIDVAPYLVEQAGVAAPGTWQGQSLFAPGPPPLAVAERDTRVAFTADGAVKSIEDRQEGKFLGAFDLASDPKELKQLKDTKSAPIAGLLAGAQAWRASTPEGVNAGPVLQLDEQERKETSEQLRALGYTD